MELHISLIVGRKRLCGVAADSAGFSANDPELRNIIFAWLGVVLDYEWTCSSLNTYSECSHSSSEWSSFHEGIGWTGEVAETLFRALRFISRLARA